MKRIRICTPYYIVWKFEFSIRLITIFYYFLPPLLPAGFGKSYYTSSLRILLSTEAFIGDHIFLFTGLAVLFLCWSFTSFEDIHFECFSFPAFFVLFWNILQENGLSENGICVGGITADIYGILMDMSAWQAQLPLGFAEYCLSASFSLFSTNSITIWHLEYEPFYVLSVSWYLLQMLHILLLSQIPDIISVRQ